MKQRLRKRRCAFAVAALAAGAAFAMLGAASSSHAASASHAFTPAIGFGVHPQISGPQHIRPDSVTFGCQSRPIDGSQGLRCYQPNQIQQAYGYSGLLASGIEGQGKTIAIVDAFSNPYVAGDLKIQDKTFGLQSASFKTVAPQGVPAFDIKDPNQDGWAEEITLDVLWAHAMAPKAHIVLVEAKSNNDSDILAALKWAVDNHVGDVISQSFGEAETCVGIPPGPALNADYHAVYQEAADKGITVFASSGDSGAAQFNCDGTAAILSASAPASDPLVTGVGGTTLNASNPHGDYLGETAWTEILGCNPPAVNVADVNCSGGGFSTINDRPSFQDGFVDNAGRGVPDVSYNAGVNGGVLTHCTVCNILAGVPPANFKTTFFLFGGTSAGSPQWSALIADADQMAGSDLGDINPQLYNLAGDAATYAADFHDVTTGNNDVEELGNAGFDAGSGWDAVTGLGTPNAANLLPDLAGSNGHGHH